MEHAGFVIGVSFVIGCGVLAFGMFEAAKVLGSAIVHAQMAKLAAEHGGILEKLAAKIAAETSK